MSVGPSQTASAGASVCGVVNWETTVEDAREYLGEVLVRKLGDTPEEDPGLYEERSPITHVGDIDVPLLVVQGATDPWVPENEAEQLLDSLVGRDVDHEYLRFDEEGRGVVRTENRVEYIARTVEFFGSQLRAEALPA